MDSSTMEESTDKGNGPDRVSGDREEKNINNGKNKKGTKICTMCRDNVEGMQTIQKGRYGHTSANGR